MTKRSVLGAAALLLLAGAIALLLWMRDSETPIVSASARADASPVVTSTSPATEAATHSTPHDRAALPARDIVGPAVDDDDPPPLTIEPIKRAFIQREDDSAPRPKDAPPPLLQKATIQALRAAATPGVQQCIAESLDRNPDYRHLEGPAALTVTYRAAIAGGAFTIRGANAIIQGTQDDQLVECVATAGRAIQFPAGAGQGDGEGGVQLAFEYK